MAVTGRDYGAGQLSAGRATQDTRAARVPPAASSHDGADRFEVLDGLCRASGTALVWLKADLSVRWHSANLSELFPGVTLNTGSDLGSVAEALDDTGLIRDAQQAIMDPEMAAAGLTAAQAPGRLRRILPGDGEDGLLVLYERPSPDHARREAMFQGQSAVLELTAKRTPYPEVLDYLLCFAEAQDEGRVKGAICVFDKQGTCVNHVAAPSLPENCRQALLKLRLGAGFTVYGARAGEHISMVGNIGKAPGWESFHDSAQRHDLRACWTAPVLTSGGGVLGLLLIFVDRPRQPDRWERTLVDMITRTAAIAIEYTREEESAGARLRQQEAVVRLGCYALEEHDLNAVLERAVNETANTLELPLCGMLELQPDGRNLRLRVGCGWPPGLIGQAVSVNESHAGYTLLTKAPVIVSDLRSETRFRVSAMLREVGAVSGACVMILGEHGHNYGVLGVHGRERRDFSDQDIHFIQAMANIVAAALSRRCNEQELQTSREEFQRQYAQLTAIYDTAPVGLGLFDAELRLQNLNGRMAELLGTPLETAIGRTLDELMPPVAGALEDACRRVIGAALPLPDQEIRWRPNGDDLHDRVWLCSYYPIKSSGGAVLGVNTVVQDISERNLAHEQREFLANLVACSRDAIIGKTLEGVITSWNQGAERLYGYSAGEAIGRSIDMIIPPERRHEFARIRDAWRMGEHIALQETERLCRDGRRLHVSLTISPIRDLSGRIIGASTIERDVTERKEADLALQMSEAALRRQAEELAAADRQKDDFIAMLGHELRNPLAPMASVAQLLEIENGRLGSKLLEDSIRIIDRQVKQMTRLVDDLLDVARITRGRIALQRQAMDVREAISEAVETMQPALDAKSQQLELSMPTAPLRVNADGVRLTQVICNVLSNAIKFSGERARIELCAEACEDRVRIRVRDQGEGIPADLLPRVFELFTQADRSLNRPQGGLGLGLTLVKRLVEMHGGNVAVHSEGPDRGAEALIELPLLTDEGEYIIAPVQWPLTGANEAPRRVLIVDDNVDSAQALGALLRLRGYAVDIAHDGGGAIDAARRAPPHVVFLDIGLPDMSGYEAAARLRRLDSRSGAMRLIALTGYGLAQRGGQDLSIFDHYMLKPVGMDKLQSVLG